MKTIKILYTKMDGPDVLLEIPEKLSKYIQQIKAEVIEIEKGKTFNTVIIDEASNVEQWDNANMQIDNNNLITYN